MHTGITTMFVAGKLYRSYYKRIDVKMRIESGYSSISESFKDNECIKGSINRSYTDYGSINGSVHDFECSTESVQSIQFSQTALSEMDDNEDSQTVRQSLL